MKKVIGGVVGWVGGVGWWPVGLYCQPSPIPFPLDFGFWILDLDFGLGFGTELGLDNKYQISNIININVINISGRVLYKLKRS